MVIFWKCYFPKKFSHFLSYFLSFQPNFISENLPLSTHQHPRTIYHYPHKTHHHITQKPPKRHHPHYHNQKKKKNQRSKRSSRSATIQVRVCEWRTVENRASQRPWFRNQFGRARAIRRCRGWRSRLWRLEDCRDGTRLCPVGFWEWELVDGTQTQWWWCLVDFGSKGRGRSRKREIGDVNSTARSRCCVWGWGASVSPSFSLSLSQAVSVSPFSLSLSLFSEVIWRSNKNGNAFTPREPYFTVNVENNFSLTQFSVTTKHTFTEKHFR